MARMIDVDALKAKAHADTDSGEGFVWVQDIDEAPTVDAVPVVHGRWKYYHKQGIAVCTNCSFERNLDTNFGKAVSCPNCGARMDLEEEEL